MHAHALAMFGSPTPLNVSLWMWLAWLLCWQLAGVATSLMRPTVARASLLAEASHLVPLIIGAALLFAGGRHIAGARVGGGPLWALADWAAWAMTILVAAGLAFTGWARVTLGTFWSGGVEQRQGHKLVKTGPYAFVRHPIYTGLILAGWAVAIQFGGALNLVGAALATFALWQKARVEERFLSGQLGEAAYAAYRAKAPMLIPFWR